MKIKKSYKRVGAGAVCVCLLLAMVLNEFRPFEKVEAGMTPGPKVSVEFSSELNEEKTSADVTIKASPLQDGVQVVGIDMPNGEHIDGNEAVYTAKHNGWQEFTVIYDENVVTVEGGDSGDSGEKEDDSIATPADAGQAGASPLDQILPKVYAMTVNNGSGVLPESNQGAEAAAASEPAQAAKADTTSGSAQAAQADTTSKSAQVTDADTISTSAAKAEAGKTTAPDTETQAVKPSESGTEAGKPSKTNTETQAGKPSEPNTETQAVKPSEPNTETQAVKPSEPNTETEAVKPSEPNTETEAVQPSEPSTETEAVKPSEPNTETEAVQPSKPGQETEAVKPSEPGQETEAVKPSKPGQETEAVKPSEPGQETEAVKPSEPGQETEAVQPSEPGQETEAVKPSEPGQEPEADKPAKPDEEKGPGVTEPTGDANTPVTPNIKPGDPNQKPSPDVQEGSNLPKPEVQVIRRSQVFRYEVTGIDEADQPFEQSAQFPEDGLEVWVKADAGVFPEGASAKITRITEEKQTSELQAGMKDSLPESEYIFQTVFFDIVIFDQDGNEIQPDKAKGEVKVVFSKLDAPKVASAGDAEALTVLSEPEELDTSPKIVVFDHENKAQFLDTVDTGSGIEAQAPHFSVFGVATTKGFEKEEFLTDVNGPTVNFKESVIYTVRPASGQTTVNVTANSGPGISVNTVSTGGVSVLNIPKGITLNVTTTDVGVPAISLPPSATLIVIGEGKLVATGGKGEKGRDGSQGTSAVQQSGNDILQTGSGGNGAKGGKGAGAGIGGGGGEGGAGGFGGFGVPMKSPWDKGPGDFDGSRFGGIYATPQNDWRTKEGKNGGNGGGMGYLYVLGQVSVEGRSGAAGQGGLGGGSGYNVVNKVTMRDPSVEYPTSADVYYAATGGAGGGGGGGGSPAAGIGGGGGGGGGGGDGTSGAAASQIESLGGLGRVRGQRVYWEGSGGSGGGGGNGGQGGFKTLILPGELTDSGHIVGQDGLPGTATDGGAIRAGRQMKVRVMKFGGWDYSDEAGYEAYSGRGGNAGSRGDDGRVFKASAATVTGAKAPIVDWEKHDSLMYKLTGLANPAIGGTVTGSGSYMYGTTPVLTAAANLYWRFNGWAGGGSDHQLSVKMNEFKDMTRTANFVKRILTIKELAGTVPKDNQIERIAESGKSTSVNFQVLGEGVPITVPKGDFRVTKYNSGDVTDVAITTSGGRATLTMPGDFQRVAGPYAIWLGPDTNGKTHVGTLDVIYYEFRTVAGQDKTFTLKSAASADAIASDKVTIYIHKGPTGDVSKRAVKVQSIDVKPGQSPIQIVSKEEVKANKYTWSPDDAGKKIAIEINGQPFKKDMELPTGLDTVTVYNADNIKSMAPRTLRLRLPDNSDGTPVYVEIPLVTEASQTKTLTLRSDVRQVENNPITGAAQTMTSPVLTGADGTPRPSLAPYNLNASEPGIGYYFLGWYDDTGVQLSQNRSFTYTIPADKGNAVSVTAKYIPLYELDPASIKGGYLTSESDTSFTHTFRVAQMMGVDSPTGDQSSRVNDLSFAQRDNTSEILVPRTKQSLLSWMGPDITVRFDYLSPGIYYPKMKGLTQGQPYPSGADRQWLTVSQLKFYAPAGAQVKKILTVKASSSLSNVASDSLQVKLDTPYPTGEIASLKLIGVEAGTATHPLQLVNFNDVNANKLTWGWGDTQSKITMAVNRDQIYEGSNNMNLKIGEANEIRLYNANSIKDSFTTAVVLTVELTKVSGERMSTKLTIPIEMAPTQIRVAVPMNVKLVVAPDGKILSPDLAIENKTTIPVTVGAIKVIKDPKTALQFTSQKPGTGALNQFYGVLNVDKPGGAEKLVLADLTDNTNQPIRWELNAGTVDAPTRLPFDFKGSWVSEMSGGWPVTETSIFKLEYTIDPVKQ